MRNRPYPKTKRTNAFKAKRKTMFFSLFEDFYGIRDKGDPKTLDRISSGRYCCDIDQKQLLKLKYLGNTEIGFPCFKQIIDNNLH